MDNWRIPAMVVPQNNTHFMSNHCSEQKSPKVKYVKDIVSVCIIINSMYVNCM